VKADAPRLITAAERSLPPRKWRLQRQSLQNPPTAKTSKRLRCQGRATGNQGDQIQAAKPAEPVTKGNAKAAAATAAPDERCEAALQPDDKNRPAIAGADDLKMISGVGPKVLEGILHSLGIYTFRSGRRGKRPNANWVTDISSSRAASSARTGSSRPRRWPRVARPSTSRSSARSRDRGE
jgi:predicted flap endonuclease-1-like 5' DNA nuclease